MIVDLKFLKKEGMSVPYFIEEPKNAKKRIIFIGNSLTIHEPVEALGWNKKCGMAATNANHDYVHLVCRKLSEKYGEIAFSGLCCRDWEKDYTNDKKLAVLMDFAREFNPDIIVLRIGENFNREYLNKGIDPYIGFSSLVKEAKRISKEVIITSMFWTEDLLDNAVKKVAKEENIVFIPLDDLMKNKENMALGQYENQDVCKHPSDIGMKRIAERILKAIL